MRLSLNRGTRDLRWPVATASVVIVAVMGYLISVLPGRSVDTDATSPFAALAAIQAKLGIGETRPEAAPDAQATALPPRARKALDEAGKQLEQKQFDRAIATLNAARTDLKDAARAYEMIGRALEGKQDFATARDFFTAAIDRDPVLSDAYWGVATSSEALGDLEAAIGAMRSYLHTEPDKDPERLRIAQARSALWEWEARLGRGPWGPTKGIPPGFTAEDIRRDGRGVAVRMQVPGTEQADGRLRAEIKHADKKQIFSRP